MPRARVSFVGAGPGDPELITLKALQRVREAEAVTHDRLIPREILAEARAGAEIIDVGKAPGRACVGQGHINCRLGDIAPRAREADVHSPALLITGPTVAVASVPLAVRRVVASVG